MPASCSGSNDVRVRPPEVGPPTAGVVANDVAEHGAVGPHSAQQVPPSSASSIVSPSNSRDGSRPAGNEPEPQRRIGFVQTPPDGASTPNLPQDLEEVREELHAALHRARVHLEWTEIMLLLVAYRRGERDIEQQSRPPDERR